MKFEYDTKKSLSNKQKYGIDFEESKLLWSYDNEEDIIEYLDLSTIRRLNLELKRINIDFPTWMVKKLDEEVKHIGVSRQSIIKTWLADKIMQVEHHKIAV